MRVTIAAILAAVATLVAAGMLGVASAEAPTSGTAIRSVNVEGRGTAPIPREAAATEANAAYRQAMTAALADAQSKASFLAAQAGGTLGPTLTISEAGGNVECHWPEEVGESNEVESPYARYLGVQPDIGYARSAFQPAPEALAKAPVAAPKAHGKKHKKPKAKKASTATCTVSAQLALSYTLQ